VTLRPPSETIPDTPGCYQFLDEKGRVLYVGKAKSLRSRLSSYFQDPAKLHPRTAQMVAAASKVDWVVTATEVDALELEHSLIQSFMPHYNIRLKDDKSYPWLAITLRDEWPRPLVTRGRRQRGTKYFGPFSHARSLRQTVDLLLPTFPVRTCPDAKFGRHQRSGRPCLLFDIKRCSGPCIGEVDAETYAGYVQGFVDFFSGDVGPIVQDLEEKMVSSSKAQDYERAARYRDELTAVHEAAKTQELVLADDENLDVIGIKSDDLQVAAVVVHIRHGRIVGRSVSVADMVEEMNQEALVGTVLRDLYGDPAAQVPPVIALGTSADDAAVVEWLRERRGGPFSLRNPQRGQKRRLVELAELNAEETLGRDRLRRASDYNARSRALVELQDALDLERVPFRIECYDMSHLQGTSYVGSMVVFEDGLPVKSAYRQFSIKTVDGNDDFAAMAEVLRRRLSRWREDPQTKSGKRGFAAPADLLLIDGGLGQLNAVRAVVNEFGLSSELELASLAKRFEEIYRPDVATPIRLPRGSEALFMVQRIRDEAHRFAISFHRSTRGRAMTASILDGIPGLGVARQERLIAEFGSIQAVREQSRETLLGLSWLPEDVAIALFDHLHPPVASLARRHGAETADS
jgi:excinuclease ABC subunit C